MIRYFWPSDDEQLAGQWQDSHFDEDGGWWANVQQCGAALALVVAATLVSSSTAAAQGVFPQQDDPAGSLTTLQLAQEEYAQPLVPPVNWPQPSVFTDDDVHPTFVQTFTPDDGDAWHALVPPSQDSYFVRLPFLDPEEIPVGSFPAATNPIDDASDWLLSQPPWDPTWTLLFFLDDGSTVHAFEPDEDFLPVQALPAPYVWPQPTQPFNTSDEDQLVPQFPAEDAFWPNYVAADPGSLLWAQQWTFEQNELATLAAFADEIFWSNPTPPLSDSLLWPQQWSFEQNDATGSLSIGNDPDSLQPLLVFPVADSLLPLQPFTFDPVDILPSAPFADEAYWQNPTWPLVDTLLWPKPWVFEQTDATGSLASIVDELYTPALVQPIADSLYPFQQFSQQQDDPAGHLYSLPEEYYWQNPVAPVVWPQPSIFVFDEQIVGPQTVVIDELYWGGFTGPWVPAVPAGLALNLPYGSGFSLTDPEEIPAGSLFTPTPPPVVPCTPPFGFDADTSITYFGGDKNPTQVLLCRVCNSGKPLLVRGDYAIWCQDCCSFVSKADTVMGTARAPSAFRARF